MSVIVINEVGASSRRNLILSARQRSRASLVLSLRETVRFNLTARTISRSTLGLTVVPPFNGEFNLQAKSISSGRVNLRFIRQINTALVVTFRIAPRTRASGRHKQRWRFSINGAEVPISNYSVDFPEKAAGCVVQVTLAQVLDKSLCTADAVYKFELAKWSAGDWRWRTIIDTGKLQSSSLRIGFADRKKTDSFSLSTFEPVANRLGKSPLRELIVYDPYRVAENEISSEIEYDTEGTALTVEQKGIFGLTLYKLFAEVFIERCGFAAWKTNIPDSAVKQANFSLGATFMNGIAPHCGVFEPDFTMLGETLWVRDTTTFIPAGFPAPARLTIDDFEEAGVTQEIDRLDAFRVIFNEDKEDWDFFRTVVVVLPVSETGSVFDENYSKTVLRRTSRKYYRNSAPDVSVKEDLIKEVRTTSGTFNVKGVVTEEFKYDGFGRQIKSYKKTETQVPVEGDLTASNFLELTEEETTTITYAAHPFEPSKQVQQKVVSEKKAKISVDATNQYRGKDFRQALVVADKSGNVTDDSTFDYGPTEKTTKTLEVLPNKQVRVNIVREDLINDRLDFDFSEVVYGEIGARANGRTSKVTVFETPGAGFTGYGREDLAVGELPLPSAIALARRKLKRRRIGGYDLDAQCAGLELYMDRGANYTLIDREEGELGTFSVKGFRFTGANLKTKAEAHKTTFRGRKI